MSWKALWWMTREFAAPATSSGAIPDRSIAPTVRMAVWRWPSSRSQTSSWARREVIRESTSALPSRSDLPGLTYSRFQNPGDNPGGLRGVVNRTAIQKVCAWPNLKLLKDGTLVAFIFNEPCHAQWEGDLDCWASEDSGRTWRFRGRPAEHEPMTGRTNCAAGRAADLRPSVSGRSLLSRVFL